MVMAFSVLLIVLAERLVLERILGKYRYINSQMMAVFQCWSIISSDTTVGREEFDLSFGKFAKREWNYVGYFHLSSGDILKLTRRQVFRLIAVIESSDNTSIIIPFEAGSPEPGLVTARARPHQLGGDLLDR